MSKNSSDPPSGDACLLEVGGMDCPSCAATIERAVRNLPGVSDVTVDVLRGEVAVRADRGKPDRRLVARAIRRAGYTVVPSEGGFPRRGRLVEGRLVATVLGGFLLGAGLVVAWSGGREPLSVGLLAGATIVSGWYVVPRAVGAVRARSLDIHVLMTVAAIGAGFLGEWGEAAAAMWLFGVAQWLERYAIGRARRAITALMQVVPREATVRRNGVDLTVSVDLVQVNETLLIRPGDRVPLDGTVTGGRSPVDQSAVTGESLPVDKEAGDSVYAGSINGSGSLEVRVTHIAKDTTIARILHAVEEAQASRAPSQSFVDRFAKVYTPLVVSLSILLAIAPPLVFEGTWETWITRGLTLLVVACPCALVIATPVSITSGLAGAARRGILIKGGAQLESLADLTAMVFDKTGTLTEGALEVTEVVPLNGVPATEVLRFAAGVERHSEHPVARAIVARARADGLDLPEPLAFSSMSGSGARGTIEGRDLFVGNTRVCAELGNCDPEAHELIDRFEREGKTGVVLMDRQGALGVVALADRVRQTARETVELLRRSGLDTIVMLTGDNPAVAQTVADLVQVTEVRSGLLPIEKQDAVTRLQQEGHRVGVVGDGINDTPALASADAGIAMGVVGTPAALEVADVALMGDDLTLIPKAVALAQRTRRILRSNLALALGLKAAFLVLAAAGVATLWMAVAADTGASVLVVINALRAAR